MVYRRAKGNIRKATRRRRAPVRRRRVVRRRRTMRRQVMRQNDCHCPGELTPTAKFALAQIDPFDNRALGAKIPDSTTIPSIANCDTDQVTLTTTAGFPAAIAFAPSYKSATVLSSNNAATLTWGSAFSERSKAANIYGNIEAIRPVAHAIRISSGLAPTAATGFVHIGLAVESRINPGAGTDWDYPVNVSQMTGLQHYQRFTLASLTQSPITVINKWIDDTAFRYDDPRATYTQSSSSGVAPSSLQFQNSWSVIVVFVDGAPAGVPISVEHVLMTEAIPRKDGFILGTGAAPNSPAVMSAVSSMVAQQPFSHTEAEQQSYVAQATERLQSGITRAAGETGQALLPAVEAFGYGATRYATAVAGGFLLNRLGVQTANNALQLQG